MFGLFIYKQLMASNVGPAAQTSVDASNALSTIVGGGGVLGSAASAVISTGPLASPVQSLSGPGTAPTATTAGGDLSSEALSPGELSQNSSSNALMGGISHSAAGTALDHATALSRGSAAGSGSGGGGGGGSSVCCENGRPIMTDPVSGQTVCSCQYDSARLALSGYSRLPPPAAVGVYGTPYPSTEQNPYQSIGVDSSAFYTPLVSKVKVIEYCD